MSLILDMMRTSDIHHPAISAKANIRAANVMPQPKQANDARSTNMNANHSLFVGARLVGRFQRHRAQVALLQLRGSEGGIFRMKKRPSILIMAGGTGGHISGSDITRTKRALVSTENAPASKEVCRG